MIYDEKYYKRYALYSDTKEEKELMDFRVRTVSKAIKKISKQKPLVVDYGCAAGGFLKTLKNTLTDKQCIGVDVNPYCIAACTKKNIKTFSPEMFDYFYEDEKIDIMTFWDTLEHLRDPKFLLDMHKPEYICISVPCLDAFEIAMPGEDIQLWKHYRPEEHLWNFKEDTLSKFLEQINYKVIHRTFEESKYRVDPILGDKNIITVIAEKIND